MCIFTLFIYTIFTCIVYTMIRHVHQDLPGLCVAMMLQISTEARPATSTDVVVLSPGKPKRLLKNRCFTPICQAAKKT